MVHHISLLETNPDVTTHDVELIMVETRIRLLKIPEVMNLRTGKRIESGNRYNYFFSFDAENLDKLEAILQSGPFAQYQKQVIEQYVASVAVFNFEMEPNKDVAYS